MMATMAQENGKAKHENGANCSVSEDKAPSANGSNRDERGRFVQGNEGGPGNPFTRRVAALRTALLQQITEEDIQEVARRLLAQAKEGDLAAIKLLLQYAIGKPLETVNPDRLDHEELEGFVQAPALTRRVPEVYSSFPMGLACRLVRGTLPALDRDMSRILVAGLDEMNRRDGLIGKKAKSVRSRQDAARSEASECSLAGVGG
jgi:hypothetical protein